MVLFAERKLAEPRTWSL